MVDTTFADIHKVEGMKGIYIASQVLDSVGINPGVEHLRSLITFDWGGEWRPITAPKFTSDHQPIYCDVVSVVNHFILFSKLRMGEFLILLILIPIDSEIDSRLSIQMYHF